MVQKVSKGQGRRVPISHYIHTVLVNIFKVFWFTLLPIRFVFSIISYFINLGLNVFYATPLYPASIEFATNHHTLMVVMFAIPFSFLYDLLYTVRDYYIQVFLAAPLLHDERVKYVQDQVKEWNAKGRPNPMCTARPAWQTMSTRVATFKKDCTPINVDLHDILEVDLDRMVVHTEPLVNMGQLSRHLLPMGYSLAIMIEMEDLTVGGCLLGVGIETNSHIYGTLADTCEAYEVILADGSLVRASKEENTDLFYGLPWSHGTLGFLVAAELKIIPCKPYMHLTYIPCHTLAESTERMFELTHRATPPSFLEVTVYSREKCVIMSGEYADVTTTEQRRKVNGVNHFWKPWFFKHAETCLSSKGQFDEYIPLRHYIHRHTRSIFWELEDLVPFGNTIWYRYLFGWLGAPKISMLKVFANTPEIRKKTVYSHVVQDVMVPITKMRDAIELFDDEFQVYPLLYYPVKFYKNPEGFRGFRRDPKTIVEGSNPPFEMYFDLGAYGIPPSVKKGKFFDAPKAVRKMEKFCRDQQGAQFLYADIFMSRDEFEQMFDHTEYRKLRVKYSAIGAFPEVWDKVKPQYAK